MRAASEATRRDRSQLSRILSHFPRSGVNARSGSPEPAHRLNIIISQIAATLAARLREPVSIASAPQASAASTDDLAQLLAPIASDLLAVDRIVRERLRSEVALIGTIGDYIVGAGGKRLRPAVLLMVARALGYHGPAHTVLAAVIEFIHTATLLHDDVVDESDLRRGRPTSNAAFGNAPACWWAISCIRARSR